MLYLYKQTTWSIIGVCFMKREEKNIQSIQKILDFATAEFSEQGYNLSSVNTICSNGGISKGILYHYFKDKDDIFLKCVSTCFNLLTEYLHSKVSLDDGPVQAQLEKYFKVRLNFFKEYPLYQRIFCDSVIQPPAHLKDSIREIKSDFDSLNTEILCTLLSRVELQPDITLNDVINTFKQYQDFINARYSMIAVSNIDMNEHENSCNLALNILLYGVIKREDCND